VCLFSVIPAKAGIQGAGFNPPYKIPGFPVPPGLAGVPGMTFRSLRYHLTARPARHSRRADQNHRQLVDFHRSVLQIFFSQKLDRIPMIGAANRYRSLSKYEHPGKPVPILIIAVDDDSDLWIGCDIAEPLEFSRRRALRFLIDGRIKMFAVVDKTNGNDVRLALGIRGSEMSDAGGVYKA
jgi:hypothetical protein